MPIPKKYRFFFEFPFDENAKEPESYTRDFFEKGDLKLFKDGEKVGVDGFFGCRKCAFYELAEFIGGKGILAIYDDTEYMLSHKEESYYVKNINRAQSACKMEEKTYITKPLYDIEASLIKYNDRVNKAERVSNGYSGNGSLTNEEL